MSDQRDSIEHAIHQLNLCEEGQRQLQERNTQGRYRLKEAANAITDDEDIAEQVQRKLMDAAQSGDLPVYLPGQDIRHDYQARGAVVRWFYEEAYWDDLNKWLDAHEQRCAFRFPPPASSISAGQLNSGSALECKLRTHIATVQSRTPAPLYGEGFSEEARKITTLTRYLEFDTWTPAMAAMLVSGLMPPIPCDDIPTDGAMGLDACFAMGNQDQFHEARHVLELWRSRVDPPGRVRPTDFIAWCKTKDIDTTWIRDAEHLTGSVHSVGTTTSTQQRDAELESLQQDWIAAAREIATGFIKSWSGPGKPSMSGVVAPHVAKELGSKGVFGRGGKTPSKETIYRHALQGWKPD